MPSGFITEANARSVLGKPPASGAWREGDPVGHRQFAALGDVPHRGRRQPARRARSRTRPGAELDAHGDQRRARAARADRRQPRHRRRPAPGHPTAGWWVGHRRARASTSTPTAGSSSRPNMLGGCQGSTGPASLAPDGREWGSRFPYLTIRDQVAAQVAPRRRARGSTAGRPSSAGRWAACTPSSGRWAIPDRVERAGVLAAPATGSADQIALNSVQLEAIHMDPGFAGGDYYEAADGSGPHRGLALARRMALLNYRSPVELNERFRRSWQSGISPLGGTGKFAVESYLDFHGNKFSRRFDANSYICLVQAMSRHDIGRDRGGAAEALRPGHRPQPRAGDRQRQAVPGSRPAFHRRSSSRDDRRRGCHRDSLGVWA